MLKSIAGRSVVITGASKGIGKGIARVFAEKGCKVLIVARNFDDAQRAALEIGERGGTAMAFAADVSDQRAVREMAAVAVKYHGGIDILCANAGIYPVARLEEMTLSDWEGVLRTNLTGTYLSVDACLPELKRTGRGRIIIISSISASFAPSNGVKVLSTEPSGLIRARRE